MSAGWVFSLSFASYAQCAFLSIFSLKKLFTFSETHISSLFLHPLYLYWCVLVCCRTVCSLLNFTSKDVVTISGTLWGKFQHNLKNRSPFDIFFPLRVLLFNPIFLWWLLELWIPENLIFFFKVLWRLGYSGNIFQLLKDLFPPQLSHSFSTRVETHNWQEGSEGVPTTFWEHPLVFSLMMKA